MNKEEAKQALNEGKKITHVFFCENEFVQKDSEDSSVLVFEDFGVKQNEEEFWLMRQDESWNEGWEIVK